MQALFYGALVPYMATIWIVVVGLLMLMRTLLRRGFRFEFDADAFAVELVGLDNTIRHLTHHEEELATDQQSARTGSPSGSS